MKPDQHLSYRPDIDGLRAVAILSVVGFHAFPAWFRGGFIGVDIFFVISGFLISSILLSDLKDERFSLSTFYARRVRRIFPALIIVLVSVLAFGYWFLWPDEYAHLAEHTIGGVTFALNLLMQQENGYFAGNAETKPLLHLWSLGVEEQFYIFWPLMLWAAWQIKHRAGLMIGVVLAASFAVNIWLLSYNPTVDFYSPFSRFWELLAGGALAWRAQTLPKPLPRVATECFSVFGTLLIIASIFALHKTTAFPGWLALLPICGAVALIAAGEKAFINCKILAHPAAVYVGLISYPLYLWHWPLLSFARIFSGQNTVRSVRIAMVMLAFALAVATYHFIEKPIRKKAALTKPTLRLAGAMVAVAAFSLTVFICKGLPQRFAEFGVAEHALNSERLISQWEKNVRFHDCHLQDSYETQQQPQCIEKAQPLVLLWGDSHAASLYPGLKHLQASQNFGIAQLTQSSCPPLFDLPTIKGRLNCNAINARILQQISELKPTVILLDSAWLRKDYPISKNEIPTLVSQSVARIKQMAPQAKVIVIGPTPRWLSPLPALYRNALMFNHGILAMRSSQHLDPNIVGLDNLMQTALEKSGIDYLSPQKELCDASGCITRFSEDLHCPSFVDEEHVSKKTAEFLIEKFAPEILPSSQLQSNQAPKAIDAL